MTRQVTVLPVTEKSVASGNWDTSRNPVNLVIIHTMVGSAASADSRFNNSTQQVSAHYGVLLDGHIWHWVDEDNTAYHAGDYAINQRSIGIEHEDNGDYNGVRPDALYSASAKLVKDICTFYNIPIDRQHILKHSEVHATGCPDALDIDRIVREAAGSSQTPSTSNDNYLVQFDQGLTKLKGWSVTDSDRREDYYNNTKYLDTLDKLHQADQNKAGKIEELTAALATCRNQTITTPTTPSVTLQIPPKPLPKATPKWLVTFINKLLGK